MPLFMLSSTSYRGELGPVGEAGVEYTHLASLSVLASEPPVRAFVKVYPLHYDSGRAARGLVNEVVGYFCADRAGLPVAPKAGLIVLEASQLASAPPWLNAAHPVVAWWTEDACHPSIRATWNFDALPEGSSAQIEAIASARDFLIKHAGTPAVVALDDLVANIDRNLGNLLAGAGKLTLIDHGRSLTGPAWIPPELVSADPYPNVIRGLLGAAAETLPFKGAVMAEYSSIVSKVSPVMPELKVLLDGLLEPSDSAAAHDFILGRTAPRSIARRIGVVA